MDSALNADAQQMEFDDALATMQQRLTTCVEGIARLEARPPVDLDMLERGMDLLTKALPPRQPQRPPAAPPQPWWFLPAVGTGCLVLGLLLGWQGPRWVERTTPRQAHLMEQVDSVLRQHWSMIPATVRDTMTTLYKQAGYQPPTELRKGK